MSDEETKELFRSLLSALNSIDFRLKAMEKLLTAPPAAGQAPSPLPAGPATPEPQPETPPAVAPEPGGPLPEPPPLPAATESRPEEPPPLLAGVEGLPAPPPPLAMQSAPKAPPARPTPPPLSPQARKAAMEKSIGIWMSRIGVVLVFFASAFFLKIAYDHLGEVGKASLGIILGLAFLGGGEFMESRKFSPLARALTGGGLMILYLALFATTAYFKMLGAPAAFALMILVTATGVVLSVRYDSQVVLILALIGGFATPPLVSTGVDRQTVLMLYLMLLDSALVGVAYWRKWRGISLLCFAGTLILFMGWAAKFYSDDKFGVTFAFGSALFVIFSVDGILHGLIRREKANREDLILVTVNAAVYFIGMYYLITEADVDRMLGPYALGLCIFYFLQSRAALAWTWEDLNLQRFLTGLAVLFLTVAIPLHLEYESVTLVWSVEALTLTAWGLYSRNKIFYYGGLIILVLAVFHLFTMDFELYHRHLLEDKDFKLISAIVVTFLSVLISVGGVIYAHHRFQDRHSLPRWVFIAAYVFETMLFMTFMLVLNHYCFESGAYSKALYSSSHRGEVLNVSLILGIYSFLLVAAGILYRQPWLRYQGLPILGFTLLKVVFYDLKGLDMTYRVISFLALGFLLIGLSFLYNKYKDQLEGIALSDHDPQRR